MLPPDPMWNFRIGSNSAAAGSRASTNQRPALVDTPRGVPRKRWLTSQVEQWLRQFGQKKNGVQILAV